MTTAIETGESTFSDKRWHITRGVPLALIFTMIAMFSGQTVGAIWYLSHLDSRVEVLEKAQLIAQPQGERLARLEEKVVAVQATANRIEGLLTSKNR
jgi:hypothetical protein